jgi:UDP-N-acetylmuramoylalanine--D-glutamate ligase
MKKVLVIGGGISGIGAALLAKKQGYEVLLSDARSLPVTDKSKLEVAGVQIEEEGHSLAQAFAPDFIIKSPGVPGYLPWIKVFVDRGISVISEIEFAARYTKGHIIGITGSNGKTTTTLLTFHLLQKHYGDRVLMAGNIGQSMAAVLCERDADFWVLELSSFQLEDMYATRIPTAVVLNVTPDHLDRYGYDFELYFKAKARIAQNQLATDVLIWGGDSPSIQERISLFSGDAQHWTIQLEKHSNEAKAFLDGNSLVVRDTENQLFSFPIDHLPLIGPHNLQNIAASILAAHHAGMPVAAMQEAMHDFVNAPHRLELVGELNGIRYINDSKATNLDSTIQALKSMDRPVVLMLGGVDKGNDYSVVSSDLRAKIKVIIAIGVDNTKIKEGFADIRILESDSMEDALHKASQLAATGDVILLAPACASFDRFKNYEDRGNQFRSFAQHLMSLYNGKN